MILTLLFLLSAHSISHGAVVGERVIEGVVEAFDQNKVSIRAGNRVFWVPRKAIDSKTRLEEGQRVRAHLTPEQYKALTGKTGK